MANCEIIPIASAKACSGKCKGNNGCAPAPTVWVLAACEGMAALFAKRPDGHLLPLASDFPAVSAFDTALRDKLVLASEHGDFSQLVLVGSPNDIAWTQASLPSIVSKHVVAEIEYPLIPAWFGTAASLGKLTQALDSVFEA
jgi:hypothetical protein